MRLPQVREQLELIALDKDTPPDIRAKLFDLIEEMKRRRNGIRGRSVCQTVTPEIREAVIHYHESYPDLAQLEIANIFNINQGRVSEILHGYRE